AAVRPTRRVRRVPGLRCVIVTQALAIVMADHRRALTALCPVAAGAVVAGREGGAVRLRAGEDVVHVRCVATAVDHLALLVQRRLLGDVVVRAVQLGDILPITVPLEFCQGPAPMRSRALTAPAPCVLRYACHVLLPAPAACASV